MRYPLTFITDFGVPEGRAACARGPVIFIRPKYRDDTGLYAHEWVHVKQSFMGMIVLHAVMYLLNKDYRFACEVEAYREQAKHYLDDRRPKFAMFIATKYGLDVTEEEALKALQA